MAVLEKIVVQDFRNIALGELAFSPNINCVSGNNGEGKTNLLDAIYYLSMTKSAFPGSDRFHFRYGTDRFSLAGQYILDGGQPLSVSIQVTARGEKVLRRDGKTCRSVSEHIGRLPVVMVSPADSAMVSESGEQRRRFLNGVLSQMDTRYLSEIQQYNRLLGQRNKLLKDLSVDPDLLTVFDKKMSSCADYIYQARAAFARQLGPAVGAYYRMLSGGRETVDVRYGSDLDQGVLEDLLAASRSRDLALRFTTAGIQRDDLLFLMDGQPIRRYGSQGQQKSFLVSLKFAQYELMKQEYGFAPMLLLDDVFDKLDMGRISNLLSMVAGNDFGQIFITDSNKVRMAGIVDGITRDRAYFEATDGAFVRARV